VLLLLLCLTIIVTIIITTLTIPSAYCPPQGIYIRVKIIFSINCPVRIIQTPIKHIKDHIFRKKKFELRLLKMLVLHFIVASHGIKYKK